MERKLIEYLPHVVRGCGEYQGIMGAEQLEFEVAWAAVNSLLDNQFLGTAGDLGLSRWEKILNITPKGTDTLDDRRFRILTRMNEEVPYTLPQLRMILENLCGKDNYTVELEDATYILTVKVGLSAKSNFYAVKELLQRMVPVNLSVNLLQMYTPHTQLSRFTHKQLSAYSNYQLRNEVFQ